jgi:predicted MFS family arabinose efflux permease
MTLSPARAFAVVALLIGSLLAASATPTPLYGDYAARWHFSSATLTVVYAVYAIGVLTSLLTAGRISDRIGRRPVIAVALAGLLVSMGLFMEARSEAWLFAARSLQGLATGLALGAAGAALLDLHPRGDAGQAGLVNGVVSALGIGTGALLSGALVEVAPDPTITPFAVMFVVFAAGLFALVGVPETVERSARVSAGSWRPQRPRVPSEMRGTFALAAAGVAASWSIGGLYLSLAPALAGGVLHSRDHVVGGLAVFALAGAGAVSQLLFRRLDARTALRGGLLGLAAGMAALVATLSTGSPLAFFTASAITGLGFGVAFMGALRDVSVAAPEAHRGSVMSAFFVVAYLSLSLPAIAAGITATDVGVEPTFRLFGAGVVAVALGLTLMATRLPAASAARSA